MAVFLTTTVASSLTAAVLLLGCLEIARKLDSAAEELVPLQNESELYRNLYYAIDSSSLPKIVQLIQAGVDLGHRYEDGKTPLHIACEKGSLAVCKLLLNRGADPRARDIRGMTPLLYTVEWGHLDIFRLLTHLGLDASAEDDKKRSAVIIAAENGHFEILRELYAKEIPSTAEYMLAIQKARQYNQSAVTDFLQTQMTPSGPAPGMDKGEPLESTTSYCRSLQRIVDRQISEPSSPGTFVSQIIETLKGISAHPHKITSQESQLFATLYRAISDNSANARKAWAESHLTTAKIIAKSLGLESEVEMNRPFGPELGFYALSSKSIPNAAISEALDNIYTCLVNNKHRNSFGSLLDVGISANTRVCCCVFGSNTPADFIAATQFICDEVSIPVIIVQDSIDEAASSNLPPTSWLKQPVHHAAKIDLSGYSVGEKGDMKEAGSFGFYGVVGKDTIYGFTAAHCTPEAEKGSIIVCPSTLELTGRLEVAVQYTSLAPKSRRKVAAREAEVQSLLRDFRSEKGDDGCEILLTADSGEIQETRLKLYGPDFGVVEGKSASYVSQVLVEHNRRLHQQETSQFQIPDEERALEAREERDIVTRIEWCCFKAFQERSGGNRLNSDTRENIAVRGSRLLEPDMRVSKIGRTTGETEGTVNGCVVQRWVDNIVSTEIAVLGSPNVFADVGDSGSLVVTADDDHAVGMLIGKTNTGSLALVSPLWAVLEDVQAKLKMEIGFYIE